MTAKQVINQSMSIYLQTFSSNYLAICSSVCQFSIHSSSHQQPTSYLCINPSISPSIHTCIHLIKEILPMDYSQHIPFIRLHVDVNNFSKIGERLPQHVLIDANPMNIQCVPSLGRLPMLPFRPVIAS